MMNALVSIGHRFRSSADTGSWRRSSVNGEAYTSWPSSRLSNFFMLS